MRFSELRRGAVFALTDPQAGEAFFGPLVRGRFVKIDAANVRFIGGTEHMPLSQGIQVHTEFDPPLCKSCRGRGYVLAYDPAKRPVIARCGTCQSITSDAGAAMFAQADGIRCRDTPPCLLQDRADVVLVDPAQAAVASPLESARPAGSRRSQRR